MDASSLQNPSDPDATYRIKAGKEHRGYSANITETVDKNGSVVTDYQYGFTSEDSKNADLCRPERSERQGDTHIDPKGYF